MSVLRLTFLSITSSSMLCLSSHAMDTGPLFRSDENCPPPQKRVTFLLPEEKEAPKQPHQVTAKKTVREKEPSNSAVLPNEQGVPSASPPRGPQRKKPLSRTHTIKGGTNPIIAKPQSPSSPLEGRKRSQRFYHGSGEFQLPRVRPASEEFPKPPSDYERLRRSSTFSTKSRERYFDDLEQKAKEKRQQKEE